MNCIKCELPAEWAIEVRLPDGRGYRGLFCEVHKIEATTDLDSRGFLGISAESMN